MTPEILRDLSELRARHSDWRKAGETIGVVPTMGALHRGHLSLVETAKQACDRVIVTIFVNPKQFNNPEDLANYPRTEEEDAQKLAPLGVDVVYVPDGDTMYPAGFATNVSVSGVTDVMEGAFRPGHFDGVATVVAKLFLQTGADKAFFGEKDYQQLLVVRRMARDLDIPIEVVACPTVREASGLAMSSRNLRLSETGLAQAATIGTVLEQTAQGLRAGHALAPLAQQAKADLLAAGFSEVEYLSLCDAETLAPVENPNGATRLFVAAHLEGVRLIDNIPV